MRDWLGVFHRCMQYSENNVFLTLYGINDDVRDAGNNKFPCPSFASAFPDGRIVSHHLSRIDDLVYRSNRSWWIVLSNIFLNLVEIANSSFSPTYSHLRAAQRFTTSS